MALQKYTETERRFLRDNYKTMSIEEIATQLGRTPSAIKSTLTRFRLLKGKRPFSAEEKEIIQKLYPNTDTAEIARQIGRPKESIYRFANKQGIYKTEEYTKAYLKKCGQMFGESGKGHRYPKGHVSANKGLRRPGWSAGRMKETQFKKGQRNGVAIKLYKPIGSERLSKDGYLERKVNDDLPLQKRWKAVHRIIWEEHHGPIPEGGNIIFIDGNKQNRDISNLKCVTDAEIMSKNTFHNYPDEIKQQIHILAGFNRKLNHAKKQNRRSS